MIENCKQCGKEFKVSKRCKTMCSVKCKEIDYLDDVCALYGDRHDDRRVEWERANSTKLRKALSGAAMEVSKILVREYQPNNIRTWVETDIVMGVGWAVGCCRLAHGVYSEEPPDFEVVHYIPAIQVAFGSHSGLKYVHINSGWKLAIKEQK